MTDLRHRDYNNLLAILMPSLVSHADFHIWIDWSGKGHQLCSAFYTGNGTFTDTSASTLEATSVTTDIRKVYFEAFVLKWQHTFVPFSDWEGWIGQFFYLCITRSQSVAAPALTDALPRDETKRSVEAEKDYGLQLPELSTFKLKDESDSKTNNSLKRVLEFKDAQKWYSGPITNLFNQLQHNQEVCEKFEMLFKLFKKLNATMGFKNDNFIKSTKHFEDMKPNLFELKKWVQQMQKVIDTKKEQNYDFQCALLKELKEEFVEFERKTLQDYQDLLHARQIVEYLSKSKEEEEDDCESKVRLRPSKRACSKNSQPYERLQKKIKKVQDDEETIDLFEIEQK